MGSMREKLEKLGFKSTVPPKKEKVVVNKNSSSPSVKNAHVIKTALVAKNPSSTAPAPEAPLKINVTKSLPLQKQVTYCDACGSNFPDVEFYEHKNKILSAKWLCSRCADQNSIHDDTRTTAQSDFAKRGLFRREYGPTNKKLRNKK